MRELSLNVLDIAQNSISANASLIEIEIIEDTALKEMLIGIYDNGKGMTQEQVQNVLNIASSTETYRDVVLSLRGKRKLSVKSGYSVNLFERYIHTVGNHGLHFKRKVSVYSLRLLLLC